MDYIVISGVLFQRIIESAKIDGLIDFLSVLLSRNNTWFHKGTRKNNTSAVT